MRRDTAKTRVALRPARQHCKLQRPGTRHPFRSLPDGLQGVHIPAVVSGARQHGEAQGAAPQEVADGHAPKPSQSNVLLTPSQQPCQHGGAAEAAHAHTCASTQTVGTSERVVASSSSSSPPPQQHKQQHHNKKTPPAPLTTAATAATTVAAQSPMVNVGPLPASPQTLTPTLSPQKRGHEHSTSSVTVHNTHRRSVVPAEQCHGARNLGLPRAVHCRRDDGETQVRQDGLVRHGVTGASDCCTLGAREGETGTDDVKGGGQPPSKHTATQLMLDSLQNTMWIVRQPAHPERTLTCCDGSDSCRQVEAVHATPNGPKVWVLGSKASGDEEGTEEQPCTTAPAAAAKRVANGKGRQASTKAK